METISRMYPTSINISMDDDDISLLLAEPDAASRQAAFDAVVGKFWKPMCSWLQREQGIRDHADQEDIVTQVLKEFHGKAMLGVSLNGPTFVALLFTILKCRGIDHLRRRAAKARGAAAYEDYLLNETLSVLRREGASVSWIGLTTDGSAKALMEDFRSAVPDLPPQQDAAARAVALLVDSHSQLTLENIRDAMQSITGTPITIPSAKSAWTAVRAKFRELLKNRRP